MSEGQTHELMKERPAFILSGGRGQQSGAMGKGVSCVHWSCDSADYIWLSLVWTCGTYTCSENHLSISRVPTFRIL